MKHLIRVLGAAVVALCLSVPAARASVVIAGTRVVFHAGLGEATIRLTNDNTRPALVEAWVDAGNLSATPDTAHTPFLITPPLFRMNAHRDQSLRIIFVQNKHPLPTDRESLFWLNVLEIPPKPTGRAAHRNSLRFAIHTRIKLFYRPAHLSISRTKAPSRLTWTAVAGKHGVALKVHNPTPYYITFGKVSLTVHGKQRHAKTGMVAPFGDLVLAIPGLTHLPAVGSAVTCYTLNDYGVAIKHQGATMP